MSATDRTGEGQHEADQEDESRIISHLSGSLRAPRE
jgi:hypothetical protein